MKSIATLINILYTLIRLHAIFSFEWLDVEDSGNEYVSIYVGYNIK